MIYIERVYIPGRVNDNFFTIASRFTLVFIQPPNEWLLEDLQRVKQL
jgi:hypothetical protein